MQENSTQDMIKEGYRLILDLMEDVKTVNSNVERDYAKLLKTYKELSNKETYTLIDSFKLRLTNKDLRKLTEEHKKATEQA